MMREKGVSAGGGCGESGRAGYLEVEHAGLSRLVEGGVLGALLVESVEL